MASIPLSSGGTAHAPLPRLGRGAITSVPCALCGTDPSRAGRCAASTCKGMHGAPPSREHVQHHRNVGGPTGREPEGQGARGTQACTKGMPPTGERLAIERRTSRSERGHWQSTRKGHSLVAYSTVSPVLNGGREETYSNATRLAPTQPGYRARLTASVRLVVRLSFTSRCFCPRICIVNAEDTPCRRR